MSCLPGERDRGGVRGQHEPCCKGMGLFSPHPPLPRVFAAWAEEGGGCFSVELLLPPPSQGCKHSIKHERLVLPSLSLLVIM